MVKSNSPFISRPFVWALTGLLWIILSKTASAGLPELSNSREIWIQEPVFDGHVYVWEAGQEHSEAIVLVHGIGSNASNDWQPLVSALASKFHVLALDLPGFGRSDKGNLLYSPKNYAAVIRYVADLLVGRPFSLIGHSMGGVVALRYAASYPEDIRRLIVMDVPGILHRAAYTQSLVDTGIQMVPAFYPGQKQSLSRLAQDLLDQIITKPIPDTLILYSAWAREKILQGDPEKIAAFALMTEDFSNLLDKVEAPTLIIWGTRDRVAPVRTGRMLVSTLPHARLKLLEGVGHVPMREYPRGLTRIILEELDRVASPEKSNNTLNKESRDASEILQAPSVVTCANTSHRVFEGVYERIKVLNCQSVVLKNVRAESVYIIGSSVEIENSQIVGDSLALHVSQSQVTITSTIIEADVALAIYDSRVDLAGVTLIGKTSAVTAISEDQIGTTPRTPEIVIFSISSVSSPHTSGKLHGVYLVSPESPL